MDCVEYGDWSWLALRDKHVYDLRYLKQFPANSLRYLAALTVPEREREEVEGGGGGRGRRREVRG